MSDLFRSYEDDFVRLMSSVDRDTEDLKTCTGAERKRLVSNFEQNFNDANELLDQMKTEAQGVPGPTGAQLRERARTYNEKLVKARENYKKTKLETDKQQSRGYAGGATFADGSASAQASAASNRTQVLQRLDNMHSEIDRHDEMLDDALRIGARTEEIGRSVNEQLALDSERITKIKTGMDEVDEEHTKAVSTMGRIAQRMRSTKCLMWLVIIVLAVVIFLIVYFKWIR